MVNVPGRSKGCATCRRRKVKCDLLLPECQRCLSLNLRCPGPRTGVIFVHTVPGHNSRSQPSLSKTKRTSVAHVAHVAQDSAVIARRDGNRTGEVMQVLRLPKPQPSPAGAFDQLFVNHFIESFGIVKPASGLRVPSTSWVDQLPSFVASTLPSPAKNAIRAASMISYGTLSRDIVILTEAHKWYAKALHDLQRFLSRDTITVTESAVCAVVMLIHFETWAGTRPKAWLSHTKGAAKMIETMGPASCRDGFMHHLFTHVRLQTFIISMSENSLHAFASHEWMTKPYEIIPKMMFDHVVDLLFSVQKCLIVAQRLISKPVGKPARDLETILSMLIEDASSHARFWASQYMPGMLQYNGTGEKTTTRDPGGANRVPSKPFRNFPTAVVLSLYNAANLINLRLSSLIPDYPCRAYSHFEVNADVDANADARRSDLSLENLEYMRQHAQSVLSAFAFINAVHTHSGPGPDRGSIMMALQLKILSLWSPFMYQREEAVALLQSDKVQKGGFASMAAETSDYFAEVAAFVLREYPFE